MPLRHRLSSVISLTRSFPLHRSSARQRLRRTLPGEPARIERLEPRLMLTFNPTGLEQEMLEHINRMRTDPQGELDLFFSSYPSPLTARDSDVHNAVSFFNVDGETLVSQWESLTPVAPVAWHASLYDAARDHNDLMITHDTQSHQLPGESGLLDRVRDAGYGVSTSLSVAENIFAFSLSTFYGHAAFAIDWGSTPSGIQDPPGHRINIMNATYQEVGIGITPDNDGGTSVGPLLITQDFGRRGDFGNPRLLGVIFEDMNGNDLYTAGEGLGGLNVHVTGTGGTFDTTTLSAGAYQLEVPAGTYTITVSGDGLAQDLVKTDVVVGTDNVKVDFEVTAPPAQPYQLAPGGELTDDTPTFTWAAIPGAARYDIWVNDLTTGQSGVIRNQNVPTNAFTPGTPLAAGHTYLWTVRAINDNGIGGEWATHIGFSIQLEAPTPLMPANYAITTDAAPTFQWSAVDGAARYDLWVNDLTTGQSGIIRNPNIPGTSYTPPTDLPVGHSYIWTVHAIGSNGMGGQWAPHRRFTIGLPAPQPTAPSAGATTTDSTPTFAWTAVDGADRYDLWVNDRTTGQYGIIRETQIAGTEFTPSTPLPVGHDYIWTVHAFASTGVSGEWAPHRTFSIIPETPSLLAPEDEGISNGLQPTFEWTAVEGAVRYDLWVNDLSTGQSGIIRNPNVTTNQFVPDTPLPLDHRYIWTVQAISDNGRGGEWAAHRRFYVRVAAPEPTAPSADGTTIDVTPTFDWPAVPGAVRYDIWANDLTTGEIGVIRDMNVMTDEYTPSVPLAPNHRYLWNVRAFSAAGVPGNWSPHYAFTVKDPQDVAPTIIAPTTVGAPAVPTFQWTGIEGAARYDIWVNNQSTGEVGVIRDLNVIGASYVSPITLNPGHKYIWTVRAFTDNDASSAWAAHRTFSVDVNAMTASTVSSDSLQGEEAAFALPQNAIEAVLADWNETDCWTW